MLQKGKMVFHCEMGPERAGENMALSGQSPFTVKDCAV
jgi:hypothetical protein